MAATERALRMRADDDVQKLSEACAAVLDAFDQAPAWLKDSANSGQPAVVQEDWQMPDIEALVNGGETALLFLLGGGPSRVEGPALSLEVAAPEVVAPAVGATALVVAAPAVGHPEWGPLRAGVWLLVPAAVFGVKGATYRNRNRTGAALALALSPLP